MNFVLSWKASRTWAWVRKLVMLTSAVMMLSVSAQSTSSTNALPTIPPPTPSKSELLLAKNASGDPAIIKVMGVAIGFVATILGLGLAMLAIWTEYRKRHDLIEALHRERMAALERGMEPPPFPAELLPQDAPVPTTPSGSGLKPGIMWLAVGVGLGVTFAAFTPSLAVVGAIPTAVGLGYLAHYWFDKR